MFQYVLLYQCSRHKRYLNPSPCYQLCRGLPLVFAQSEYYRARVLFWRHHINPELYYLYSLDFLNRLDERSTSSSIMHSGACQIQVIIRILAHKVISRFAMESMSSTRQRGNLIRPSSPKIAPAFTILFTPLSENISQADSFQRI